MSDENNGDEAVTDSRFAVRSPELSFYSDAHNLRVWSGSGNGARTLLPTSSTKPRRTAARKRTVIEKKGLFAVAQLTSTLDSGLHILPHDVIVPDDQSQSKLRPKAHQDDHEPNGLAQVDEQRHHRPLGKTQNCPSDDLMHYLIENHETTPKINEVNDKHIVHDEKQNTVAREACHFPLDLNRLFIAHKSHSTSTIDFSSQRSPKEIRRHSTKELSFKHRRHARPPALIFNNYPVSQTPQTNSPNCDRREVVIELVYRLLSCHHLSKYLSWPKFGQNIYQTPRILTGPSQCWTSAWRGRSSTPLLGVEDAWETELQQSLNLCVLQTSESPRPVGNTMTGTRGDLSPSDASTPTTSESTVSTASSTQSTPSKRPHHRSVRGKSRREDDGSPSDNEEEEHPSKKARSSSEGSLPTEKLLACPYWKYDPARYSPVNTSEKKYRGCSSVYLRDIARLKQHLYRVHKMPDYHCQRCLEIFEDEPSLEEHVRAPVELACAYRENTSSELLSEKQCVQLRKRWTGKTTEEAWKCIWSIIFPRLDPPLSIYVEDTPASLQSAQMPGFLSEFQRLAPSMLRQILIERSSETESVEMSSWLQSIDAQSILSASIEELFSRIPCSEYNQPTPPPQPITTTTFFSSELPEFGDLLNFDIFDETPADPNPCPPETSIEVSAGPLKEKPESIESVLNRSHPIDDMFSPPESADTPVKTHYSLEIQTPNKISGPIYQVVQRNRLPPRNEKGQIFCDHIDCRDKTSQTFGRPCEWNKHMDRHEKPYKCQEPGCESRIGFTFAGGLLRHQREVHKLHLPTSERLFCPYSHCKRSSGTGFSRKENLGEHIRRVHPEELPESSTSTTGSTTGLWSIDGSSGSENMCDPRQLSTDVPTVAEPGLFINPADLGMDPPDNQDTPVWHPR